MRNIKLLIEYDGTNYAGWQRQENGPSIQGEIEQVLKQILREEVDVVGAGRTDAGVHARGQAANFRTASNVDLHEMHGGLNGLLPDDITILHIEEVPFEFHARFDAMERHYSYLIIQRRAALMRNFSWYVKYPLDLDNLNRAASVLLGEHNFESFCKANSDVNHYQCTVKTATWESDGSLLRFVISADRFLHGMVRTLVGTMVDVGRGYLTYDEYLRIFEKKNRSEAGISAPARGLVLEKVVYKFFI